MCFFLTAEEIILFGSCILYITYYESATKLGYKSVSSESQDTSASLSMTSFCKVPSYKSERPSLITFGDVPEGLHCYAL